MSEVTAELMHDRMTSRAWLTFPRTPPQEVRDDLHSKGWRWSRLREAYNHPAMVTREDHRMPTGVVVEYGGLCDYNSERADLLEERGDKRANASEARFSTAHRALAGIEPGQPVLVGHHSERHHRGALRRHDTNMRKGLELHKDAARLHSAAEGSRQRRAHRTNPIAARNRLARLTQELEQARENKREDVVEVLELLVEDTRPAAEQAIAADTLEPKVGDIVWCSGLQLVVGVHEKTLSVVGLSQGHLWGWDGKVDRRKLKKIFSSGNPMPSWQASRMKPASEGGGLEYCGHTNHKTRAAAAKCQQALWPNTPRAYAGRSLTMPEVLRDVVRRLLENLRGTPEEK